MNLAVVYPPVPGAGLEPPPQGGLVGAGRAMRELFDRLDRVAASDATVLVEGETGTGKELVARVLHERSGRSTGAFVTVDCGSLPQPLLEAELFGHARGAFTGAHQARLGAIEAAHGGTVFLDEIGELPLEMQPRLLRLLEARTVKRLGENQHRAVDVRFVCATHQNLQGLVAGKRFREDLFFRLAVLGVRVPPLRERREDIPALVDHFMPAASRHLVTDALLGDLMSREWPGNVRELRNALDQLAVLGAGAGLAPARASAPADAPCEPPDELPPEWASLPFRTFRALAVERLERVYLSKLLRRHHRRISDAAAEAGINRTYLHRLIRRHRL
jgi:DNA-binding NtrC family response regulator